MEDNAIHILLIDDVKFDVSEIKRQLGDSLSQCIRASCLALCVLL